MQWMNQAFFFFLRDCAITDTATWDQIITCPLWPTCSLNLASCGYYPVRMFQSQCLWKPHTHTYTHTHTHTHTNYLAHNTENFRQDFIQILITYSPSVKHVWKLKGVVFNNRFNISHIIQVKHRLSMQILWMGPALSGTLYIIKE
jgi:hypothetical protein